MPPVFHVFASATTPLASLLIDTIIDFLSPAMPLFSSRHYFRR
jgi:hypothetical protein